jgi:hypothetical protein
MKQRQKTLKLKCLKKKGSYKKRMKGGDIEKTINALQELINKLIREMEIEIKTNIDKDDYKVELNKHITKLNTEIIDKLKKEIDEINKLINAKNSTVSNVYNSIRNAVVRPAATNKYSKTAQNKGTELKLSNIADTEPDTEPDTEG